MEQQMPQQNITESITSVAESKLAYLRDRGYRQVSVVMAGDGGCCTVSNFVRVAWLSDATRLAIIGVNNGDPRLWAMHVPGPDDVYAMASEEDAQAAVEAHNKAVEASGLAERYGLPPESVRARVIEWPHSIESHAESLESGEAEVLDTTNGMGIPDNLARQVTKTTEAQDGT